MKVLLNSLRWALVWLVICLLAIDPASACRLLAGRCCRCVCCAPSCDCDVAAAGSPSDKQAEPDGSTSPAKTEPPSEPSPSDAPSGVSPAPPPSLPAAPPAPPLPPQEPARPRQSQAPARRTFSDAGNAGDFSPQSAIPTRRSTAATPAPTAEAAAADVPAAGIAPSPRSEVTPSPTRAALAQPQTTEPAAVDSNTAERHVSPSAADAADLAPIPMTPRRMADEPMPDARPMESAIGSRSPALPGAVDVHQPVAQPAFPPTDDDPFAPVAPSRAPAVKQPDADDPFAPLPPAATQSRRMPASPTAARRESVERVAPLADPLLPAADGRLAPRQWVDASGQFRIQARLILVLGGKVRLLKETGRTTTVELEKLSAADRAYVAAVVARYGSDLSKLDQLAAR